MLLDRWVWFAFIIHASAEDCLFQREGVNSKRLLLQLNSQRKGALELNSTRASRIAVIGHPKGGHHMPSRSRGKTRGLAQYNGTGDDEMVYVQPTWAGSWWSELVVLSLFVILFLISVSCLAWTEAQGTEGGVRMLGNGLMQLFSREEPDAASQDQEVEKRRNEGLDEDAYGLAIAVVLRDTSVVAIGQGNPALRLVRFTLVLLLVFVNMSLQVFLLVQVGRFVTPAEINAIRAYYSQFEWNMYGSNLSHLSNKREGEMRGRPEFFNPDHFADVPPIVKNEACRIPFSQPIFFGVVLFIWTLTCAGELKRSVDIFYGLIVGLPTIPSLDGTLQASMQEDETSVNVKIVVGLTGRMKVFITTIILAPRFGVAAVLLWLGSQWLAATNNFGDLIMNTVALEFILLLKDLLYRTVVPNRNKRDLMHIQMKPPCSHERAGFSVFVMSFLWGVAALGWSIVYTASLQNVLDDYNWDVRVVCQAWLQSDKHQQM